MAAIRSRDTRPELRLRKLLFARGLRYRVCVKDLPGKPDMVFAGRRCVIFVHGCFWHRHEGCSNAVIPHTRQEFWISKLEGNKSRDRGNVKKLLDEGWRVLVVWECSLKKKFAERTAELARSWLEGGDRICEITINHEQVECIICKN